VLEQPGRVIRVDGRRRQTVLDLGDRVTVGAEQGLLGIAFHPDFATDRRLYLHWSDPKGDTRVAEFRAGGDGTIAERPLRELLFVDQPEENHNGGQLAFGLDGRLYLGLGDGGGAFDPNRTAQDPENLLGKIVAADVDAPEPEWQVIVTGLRNPWRFSFDAALGELWIGDVGQDETEEIDRVLLEPDEPPKNLGWSAFEGTERVGTHELDRSGELVWPVAAYSHEDGCSVTGGVVYAGSELAALGRRYVYGDFCSGYVWTLAATPEGGATDVRRERAKVPGLTHIGTDAGGELVFASGTGAIYRAVPAGS
jgi:glucose/arabinose dehydrogenase